MFRREMGLKRGSLPPKEGDLTCMHTTDTYLSRFIAGSLAGSDFTFFAFFFPPAFPSLSTMYSETKLTCQKLR